MGLINGAVSAEALDAEVASVINDLLAGEPTALAATKQLTALVPAMEIDEAFEWTSALSAKLFTSDEAREGMSAFLEKRPASWVRSLNDGELT